MPHKKTHLEKEDEAVILKMLDNGFAETKTVDFGANSPAIVIFPELGIEKIPVKTNWHYIYWLQSETAYDGSKV